VAAQDGHGEEAGEGLIAGVKGGEMGVGEELWQGAVE
jgi:hypothetical protein